MKRSVILSLFAVTLTALCATTAQATVNAQLNLFYNRPDQAGDPNGNSIHQTGGFWQLLVQTDTTNGIAGIRFVIEGIAHVDGLNDGDVDGNNQVWTDPNDPSIFNFNFVTPLDPNDGSVEIVAGDDLNGPLILFVGTGPNTPGNRAVDDLNNSFWDNSALIASGNFHGFFTDPNGLNISVRPSLLSFQANEFGADPNTTILLASNGTMSTRGDAAEFRGQEVAGSGLLLGDADRDGDVGPIDLGAVTGSWFDDPNDGALQWNEGDFDSDFDVGPIDLGAVTGNWFTTPIVPPAISAVAIPEPCSLVLLALAGLGLSLDRKKNLFRLTRLTGGCE